MTYKLICFDISGVIFDFRNFWMKVHEAYGTLADGKVLTEKYLHNDYDRLVDEVVVKLWKGRDEEPFLRLLDTMEYMKGVEEVFDYVHEQKWVIALVSAADLQVARKIQRDFGADYVVANELVFEDGKVAGRFNWPIGEGTKEKAETVRNLCEQLGINPSEAIYVGDSRTDIDAMSLVGMPIAFNAEDEAVRAAALFVVSGKDLSRVLEAFS